MNLKKKIFPDLPEERQMKMSETMMYLLGIFFFTNLTGVASAWRQAYLVDVLKINTDWIGAVNLICAIGGYVINFFLIMYIDKPVKPGKAKFTPIIATFAIPFAVFAVLQFFTPNALLGSKIVMVYLIIVQLGYGIFNTFVNTINDVAMVMTSNLKERDEVMNFRSVISAIANSAPQVVILVVGLVVGIFIDKDLNRALFEQWEYLATSSLSAILAAVFMMIMSKKVKERVKYSDKKVNPIMGYKDVLSNKYALMTTLSEFLKQFRKISTYMGVFLAAALLGGSDKYILLGLPTGVGTLIGMLIVMALLKKLNYKQIYIGSGIYSLVANLAAFGVGYLYLKNPSTPLLVLFVFFLFLIGLQFGASNMLPSLFKADILEDIEYQTGKRLEASLGFVLGLGSTIAGAIAEFLAPRALSGPHAIIGYVQGAGDAQSLKTKILLLFFYTVVHGIFMFLAGVPYFPYDLNGEKKEKIHRAVMEKRAELDNQE